MKLNKDNYELIMFELLEGTLNERDSLSVIKQIEEDEFYFKEWNLFKATVLVPEHNLTYTNKQSLLRSDTKIISLRWWLAASAACIVAAIIYTLPIAQTATPLVSQNTSEVKEMTVPLGSEEVVRKEVELQNVKVLTKRETKSYEISTSTPPLKVESERFIKKNAETKNVIVENIQPEPFIDKKMENHKVGNTALVQNKKINNESTLPKHTLVRKEIALMKKVADFVTSNPRERINQRKNEIVARLSHPKIKVKPQFDGKKPGFSIELETQGYLAIASVQPFKNIKN